MNIYEKEVAKRQQIEPAFSYSYKFIPLTDLAKFNVAIYLKKINVQFERSITKQSEMMELVTDKALNIPPFVGRRSFYYDESLEDTSETIPLVRDFAIQQLALADVPSFNYSERRKTVYLIQNSLVEGRDYKIEIGDKIVYEQPKTLTFDDIIQL